MDQDNQIREVRVCDDRLMGKGYAVTGVSFFSAHLPGILPGGAAGGDKRIGSFLIRRTDAYNISFMKKARNIV